MSTVGRIRKINVQPTVAVVVQQQHAAAHRLHNVFALRRRACVNSIPAFSVTSISCGIVLPEHFSDFAPGGGGDAAAALPAPPPIRGQRQRRK